jgi:hypothetical protein
MLQLTVELGAVANRREFHRSNATFHLYLQFFEGSHYKKEHGSYEDWIT